MNGIPVAFESPVALKIIKIFSFTGDVNFASGGCRIHGQPKSGALLSPGLFG